MPEKPKRLTPTSATVRELYLKSGNECAFPSCSHRIIDADGVLIGEICHIEAALPGGVRFNVEHTNEERRQIENLMLMCHAHHKVTDDDSAYPVARLKEMKAAHESRFTDVVGQIRRSIGDETQTTSVGLASTLAKMDQVLDWHFTREELRPHVQHVNALAQRLRDVPRRTRELLAVIIRRGGAVPGNYGQWEALHDDVVEATQLRNAEVVKHVQILQHHGFGHGEDDEFSRTPRIRISGLKSGWPIWQDLLDFSKRARLPLTELIVELRFDLLD